MVFDEAHNIDNVCIEALSVSLRQQTLDAAAANINKLNSVSGRERERLGAGAVKAAAAAGNLRWLSG